MTDLFYDQSTVWVKINQDYGRDYESLDKVTNSKIEELQSLDLYIFLYHSIKIMIRGAQVSSFSERFLLPFFTRV